MEKQNRPVVLQWIVPFAVPMIVVLIILLIFSVRSSESAKASVSEDMLVMAQQYAESLGNKLGTIDRVAGAVCDMLEQDQTLTGTQIIELLKIVADCTEADKVELCDSEGKGIDQSGEEISIGNQNYFQEVLLSEETLLYAEGNDHTERQSIVVAERINRGGGSYMLGFYPVDSLKGLLSEDDLDCGTFLALVDADGGILSVFGAENTLQNNNSLPESVRTGDADAAEAFEGYIANGMTGAASVKLNGEGRMLIYAPLGMNQWGIVLSVRQDYVDSLSDNEWKNNRFMLFSLIVVVSIFGCFMTVTDILDRIRDNRQKKELENKADTDLLTGLNNKLATERKIKDYIEQNPWSQSMMFLLDIDNFKTVNDTMGHAFGDEVLSTLGRRLGTIFRASDIIGRVGGDEFMIFLKEVSAPETIRKEARRVECFFQSFQVGECTRYDVRASIGVAVFPHEGTDFETLYKAADQGLYKAKRRGKNQLAFYEDKWAQAEEEEENIKES